MTLDWISFTPWTSLAGGLLIGCAVALFWILNGRIAGISGIIGGLFQRHPEAVPVKAAFLIGLVAAPLLYSFFSPLPTVSMDVSPTVIIIAGLCVGLGTRYGSGCTSGHGVCGLSRLSIRSLVATLSFMFAGFATVFIARHWLG